MADPTTPPLPSSLPVLPLRRTVAFPLTLQPLAVNRPASIESVNKALTTDRMLLLVLQTNDADEPSADQIERVGTVAIVRQMARADHGLNIIFEGLARVRVLTVSKAGTTITANIEPMPERRDTGVETEAYERRIRELAEKAVGLAAGASPEVRQMVLGIEDPLRLAYLIGSLLDATPAEKQDILAADPLLRKLELVHGVLSREVSVLELKGKIESQAQAEMSESQRQYYLRQQLKAIQEQLGEGEGNELGDLRTRIADAKLPEAVQKQVEREVERLSRMGAGGGGGEAQMIRTYIDWVLDVPWSTTTDDRLDPVAARAVLDEDHYDLDKVKERIVEYLAVRKLKGDMKGPILCFVGPPGVGKTSLGQSIAKAMQRKFVRISLGGVRDEAEIRGHRRTPIGSLPGRIVQALKQAGSMNPVFMLDEMDKLAAGVQGDPAAALLEVLDPAQNHTFRDHYLEVTVDLSKVLFIATANQLGTLHPALLDRMEIISLAGYTEEDKVHIARKYLVPRQLTEHGLREGALVLDDTTLKAIVAEYTREAGVRSLERLVGTIARKVAAKVASAADPAVVPPTVVLPSELDDYLGPARFKKEVAFRTSAPGVATGLAWTEAGGDVLFIEASLLPAGREQITLTGQLGSVMQESARAAVSHIRAHAGELGVEPTFLRDKDLHLHVPAGAIPKDGPSAGVTMATAILSAASGRPVREDVAMTGEITLSGMVLPVGGIREKSLAARRFGVKTVILPALNEADLVDIPPELRKDMTFVFAKTLEDVLAVALGPKPAAAPVAVVSHGPQDVDA